MERATNFKKKHLETYKTLLESTDIQKGYQEFISLFRFLRTELEKELKEFKFSGHIVENNMDFAYFQLTDDLLKSMGLKVQIIFVHKRFCFEVWVSGYNRKIQCKYYEMLKDISMPYILNNNPNRVDFIYKSTITEKFDMANGLEVVAIIKKAIIEIVGYAKSTAK